MGIATTLVIVSIVAGVGVDVKTVEFSNAQACLSALRIYGMADDRYGGVENSLLGFVGNSMPLHDRVVMDAESAKLQVISEATCVSS